MLFNSFAFAIFLPIVFILYWCLPQKCRWMLLLVASYYFYMSWNVKYVVLILFTTVVSYLGALLIEKEQSESKKKVYLSATAVICLGVLFVFKYFNFFSESLTHLLNSFSIQLNPLTLKLLLPVGISFYTFQTLSYVIDVYKGEVEAEKHFGYYATFISFFPQLVAGPIERTVNLLPQIKKEHKFDYDQASYGIKLMLWGFFKKIVIADTLSGFVSVIYDNPKEYTGFALILATFFFTIQIYCDFSGYSDIAIGTAKLLGINLMTNFKSPYFSQSVKEFWSRWHISLSTWFRDYIYIPLGGNRVGKVRQVINLLVTFLVSGLWHGANWTFLVWGGIHGVAQAIENVIIPKDKRKSTGIVWLLRVVVVFIFASFAWIFFVSNSISDAGYVIAHAFDGIMSPVSYIKAGISNVGIGILDILIEAVVIFILFVYDYLSLKKDVISEITKMKKVARWAIYIVITLMIIFLSPKGVAAEFVYFQF